MQLLCENGAFTTRLQWTYVFRHIFRELNEAADAAAKQALQKRASFWTRHIACETMKDDPPKYLWVFTDGSHSAGIAGAGFVVYGAWRNEECD